MRFADRFVGTWRLISFVGRHPDGRETDTYGSEPCGVLMYDAGGRMSVQITRADRPAGQLGSAADGYFGYFGRYTVDEHAGTVTHHIDGSSDPAFAGTDQRRLFTWQGDRLMLKTSPGSPAGSEITYVATWERQASTLLE